MFLYTYTIEVGVRKPASEHLQDGAAKAPYISCKSITLGLPVHNLHIRFVIINEHLKPQQIETRGEEGKECTFFQILYCKNSTG